MQAHLHSDYLDGRKNFLLKTNVSLKNLINVTNLINVNTCQVNSLGRIKAKLKRKSPYLKIKT